MEIVEISYCMHREYSARPYSFVVAIRTTHVQAMIARGQCLAWFPHATEKYRQGNATHRKKKRGIDQSNALLP